jgi:acyl carrier protein phosphodiesterase
MNFLAHIYLSNNDPEIMIGNFIGDFVKGRNYASIYEKKVARGIELHRLIDEYTDRHVIVGESKSRLRAKYRHYSPVIVDIFYDHFLARYWDNYHPTPLRRFAQNAYDVLLNHKAMLPTAVKNMLPYMIKDNWLLNYGTLEGISQALNGISRRTVYDSKMNESIVELKEFYAEFREDFEAFLPDITNQAQAFLLAE